MRKIRMPDGTFMEVPPGTTDEEIEAYLQYRSEFASQRDPSRSGIGSLRRGEDEGTTLGAAWQGLKNIPRGAQQFALMARQGIEALRTPDEDTAKEKEIRRKLNALYASQDPRYRESNLAQLGMGLGQVGAMIGTSLIPIVGKPVAYGGAMLMGAGEAAGRLAEYEERTGEDVATGKEIKALAGGLGLGLFEMVPFGVPARAARHLRTLGKGVLPSTGRQAAESLAARTVRRSGASALERGVEDAAKAARSYAASALISGGGEAVQEAAAGFGQSALGLWLYDEDAMANAGPNALKEAIIGGEVGAVADVLMRMAGARRKGGHRRHQEKRIVDAVEKEVAEAWADIKGGNIRLDRKEFTERVRSTDPNDQAFIAAILDGSLLESARAESEARQAEIRAEPNLKPEVRDQQLKVEVKKAADIVKHIELMKFGVEVVRSGKDLAPDEVASEIVAAKETPERRWPSPEEGVPIEDELRSRRELQADVVERADRGELTAEDAAAAGEATMSGIAPVDVYDAKHALSYVWQDLRPTRAEVGAAERARLQKEGLDEAAIKGQVDASVDAFTQGGENVLALSGRLVTQGQRDALGNLVEMAASDGPALGPTQLRDVVNGVFQGGVYDMNEVSWDITEGVPTIAVPALGVTKVEAKIPPRLETTTYEGEVGRGDHITARQMGTVPVASLRLFKGARDEVRGVHGRREGVKWDEFKADIAENGMRTPIFVTVEYNQLPKISEGNHRLDAAIELGMKEVPVEIKYFGKAEDQGWAADRLDQLRSTHPRLLEGMDDPAWEGLGTPYRGTDPEGVSFRNERTRDWDYEVSEWDVLGMEAAQKPVVVTEIVRPPTAKETKRGADRASDVLNSVMSFDALAGLGTQVTDKVKGTETTDAGRGELAVHVAEPDVVGIVDDFKANDGKVTEDLAQRALAAKEIAQDLNSFAAETLEMGPADIDWESLQEGEQHAVFSRILRSNVQSIRHAAHPGPTTLRPEAQQGVLAALAGTPILDAPTTPAAVGDAYVVTQEAVSVKRHGFMAALAESSAEVRERFTLAMRAALTDANGTDRTLGIVERVTGVKLDIEVLFGRGLWGGELNPNEIVVLRTEFDQANEEEVALENRVVEVYMAVNGIIRGQDAQAAARVRPENDTTGGDSSGWLIGSSIDDKIGALDPAEIDRVLDVLRKKGYGATSIDTHGNILVIDFDNEGGAALKEVMVGLAAEQNLAVEPRRFDSKYMAGTRSFLEVIQASAETGEADTKDIVADQVAGMVEILNNNVARVYETFAEELGVGPGGFTGLTARVEELEALSRELRVKLPRGQTTGKSLIDVVDAAHKLKTAHGRTPIKTKSLPKIIDEAADRMKESIDRFLVAANISAKTARDWYAQGAREARLIAQLALPELRNDADYTLFTVMSSILSNGNEVDNELRSAVGVMEQYYATGVFSLLKVDEEGRIVGEKTTTMVRRKTKKGKTFLFPQPSMKGEKAPGLPSFYNVELVPGSERSITHEAAYGILNDLIAELGPKGAADFLRTKVVVGKRNLPVLTELFGPKIGQYAADKMGLDSPGEATLDLWMARGYHMLMGRVKQERDPKGKGPPNKRRFILDDEITAVMKKRLNKIFQVVAEEKNVPLSTVQAEFWYAVKWEFREQRAKEKAGAYATLPSAVTQALLLTRNNIDPDTQEVLATTLDMGSPKVFEGIGPKEDLVAEPGWNPSRSWVRMQRKKEYKAAKKKADLEEAGLVGEAAAPVVATPVAVTKPGKGVYKKISLGKPGKRSLAITILATELNVGPEQVVDYIERTIAAGLVKYTNAARTQVQFVSPQEAAEYAPKPTERSVDVERIKEEIRREGKLRSEEQLARDAENVNNARLRLDSFKEKARAQFKRMGKPDVGINIVVAADSIYADIKDIYVDPDVIVENRSRVTGPSASVRNHGAMVLFNLSQMEGRYKDGIKTDIDTLVKDSAFHEGAHLWYLNDDLQIGEQRSLEGYGKRERVPKAVNEDAFDAGQTWRQWTESMYGKTDPNIVEETSVRILDALAQGQIPRAKSAGFMSKIARDLFARAKGIVGAARDSDVLSVMDIYEKIQGGELRRRSEAKKLEFGGASTVQILDRATPEQFEELRQAAETGSETEVEAAARKIVRSRAEGPTISLQQSLLNDLRARREIEDTPDSVMPVLNKQAIEAGEISAAALNAYFEFNDASVRPYSFLEGTRYKGDSPRQMLEGLGGTQPGGHNSVKEKDGKSRPIATTEDIDKQITYAASDLLRMKFLDKRLPQWFSAKRAAGRKGALKQLAHLSAIAAWRMADASQLYLSNQMYDGPIVWDNTDPDDPSEGGISFGTDLEVDGRRVKAFRDISNPLLKAGEKVIARAYEFLAAHRIVDVFNELAAAKAALKAARAKDAALVAAHPSPPVDPRLLPTPKLPKGLAKAAPRYSNATLQFDSDIDRAAYIIGNRKGKRSKADAKYVAWLAERGVSLEAAIKLRTKIIASIKPQYTGAAKLIRIPADAGANQAFAPAVPPIPGLTAPTTMSKLENAVTIWKERYDKVNPQRTKADKGRPRKVTIEEMRKVISAVEVGVKNGDANSRIIANFKQEYGDFNYHQIEFLFKTGQITNDKKLTLQKLSYVPFMRDQGWEQSQPLVNSKSDGSRGEMMIDKSLEGSWADLDPNLMGSIISNISAVTRDGLWNIAAQRTVRDELFVGTAREITNENRSGEGKRELDEAGFSDIVVMLKIDGNTKVFRLKDPLLSQSIMMSGFNPAQTIETFFGKVFMAGGTTLGVKNEKIAKGLRQLLIQPSRALRELVVRSPPFIAKNILRDSMQASVTFGGGPLMTLKAIKNVFTRGLLAKAQRRGLSQPIDYTPGKETAAKAERLLTQDEIRGLTEGPIPVFTTLWDWLGHAAQKSEVATRMAVYDAVMEKTGKGDPSVGDTTEAMYQAMEIMNYSRRGSSPLFTTLAAMSPFINGRMQGLDVFLRTQLGSADAPGLYGKEFDDSAEGRLQRMGTAAARGSYIAFGTFLYWLAVHDDEEYKNTPENLRDDWWLLPMPKGRLGLKIPIPFEVGLFYKVIPEQILRTISEDQHDFGDMTDAMKRQVFNTLWLDLRPQAIRPMIDAMANRSVWTRDQIVPTWMNNSVAASEQYNPATNEVARLVSKSLDSIPLLKSMDFLTSPMKMEYMLRQYGGTLGTYIMVLTDRLIREAGDKNIVGTPSDFGFDTWDKMPLIGDLLYDRESGGGYQESFYKMLEDLELILSTIGAMEEREDRDRTAEDEYKDKHEPLLIAGKRLKHFDKRMDHWRRDRDRLFTRNDLSDQDKRRTLYRMFEDRDDILSEMLDLMGDVRGAKREQLLVNENP